MVLKGNANKDFVEMPEGKRPHRWGIILKWNLKSCGVKAWTGVVWVKIGASFGLV
jgi:hypothetical protein